MSIQYRMANESDIMSLVSFWKEHSGWDSISEAEWKRRFYYTPFGSAQVVIAFKKDTNEIQGQIVFFPTKINVDNITINSYRPFALIMHKNLRATIRFLGLLQIISKMYNCAIAEFKSKGIGLIHMMPDPGWVRAFKFLTNVQTGSYQLYSLPIPLKEKFYLPPDININNIEAKDEQINQLWLHSRHLYGCSLIRDAKTIEWKISHGNYKLVGVFKNKKLIGLAALQIKEKDKQWVICDLLTHDANEAFDVTLKALCNYANDETISGSLVLTKIAILVIPMFEGKLEKLGFLKDNYRFPIVVQILDKSILKEKVSPQRWYVSAND